MLRYPASRAYGEGKSHAGSKWKLSEVDDLKTINEICQCEESEYPPPHSLNICRVTPGMDHDVVRESDVFRKSVTPNYDVAVGGGEGRGLSQEPAVELGGGGSG